MRVHEFFHKYANVPLSKRFTVLNMNKAGTITLNDIYDEINKLEDVMRPMRIRQDELLKLAEEYFNRTKK